MDTQLKESKMPHLGSAWGGQLPMSSQGSCNFFHIFQIQFGLNRVTKPSCPGGCHFAAEGGLQAKAPGLKNLCNLPCTCT